MTHTLLLLRCVAFAALIYVGVWLDSKAARTVMFTSFFLAIEGCWWVLLHLRAISAASRPALVSNGTALPPPPVYPPSRSLL